MMNQRQATVSTILAVLKDAGVQYELNGDTAVSEVLTDTLKAKVRELIFVGFRNGTIEMSDDGKSKYSDDSALKVYISGLVNNWIRKAPEFNSGSKYQAKNPGIRAGSGDEQIKEMKKLLNQTTDPKAKAMIEEAIEKRREALKPTVEINVDALPEGLRHLVK